MNRKVILISTAILFVIIAVIVVKLYTSHKNQVQTRNEFLTRSYSSTYGNQDAKVILTEFLDPACSTCAQFFPFVKELVKNSNGKLKVVYRYAPLHKDSDTIATILELAKEQGIAFDEALNTLFSNQDLWVKNHVSIPEVAIVLLEQNNGFDAQKAQQSQIQEVLDRVKLDINDMDALGINKTPSFFVNGKPLQKFGYDELVKLINSEIKAVYEINKVEL
jgi:protein-disulfide isomerase